MSFLLRHLSNLVEREAPLVRDASAPCKLLFQGGRTSKRDEDGNWRMASSVERARRPWLSPLFSAEITREVLPWVHEKGGKPSLIIATLEALAVLVSLKTLHGEQPASGKETVRWHRHGQTTAGTDLHSTN